MHVRELIGLRAAISHRALASGSLASDSLLAVLFAPHLFEAEQMAGVLASLLAPALLPSTASERQRAHLT